MIKQKFKSQSAWSRERDSAEQPRPFQILREHYRKNKNFLFSPFNKNLSKFLTSKQMLVSFQIAFDNVCGDQFKSKNPLQFKYYKQYTCYLFVYFFFLFYIFRVHVSNREFWAYLYQPSTISYYQPTIQPLPAPSRVTARPTVKPTVCSPTTTFLTATLVPPAYNIASALATQRRKRR